MCLLCPFLYAINTNIWVLGAIRSMRKTVYQVDHPSGLHQQQCVKRLGCTAWVSRQLLQERRIGWPRVLFVASLYSQSGSNQYEISENVLVSNRRGVLSGVGSGGQNVTMDGSVVSCCDPRISTVARWETMVRGSRCHRHLNLCQTLEGRHKKCPGLIVFSSHWNPM